MNKRNPENKEEANRNKRQEKINHENSQGERSSEKLIEALMMKENTNPKRRVFAGLKPTEHIGDPMKSQKVMTHEKTQEPRNQELCPSR